MKRVIRTCICTAMSLSMVFALTPLCAQGQEQSQTDGLAEEQLESLDEMLAQGSYKQGEALVVWQDSVWTSGSVAKLLAGAEVLTTTDAQTYQQTTGDSSVAADKEVKVGLVTSSTMSTRALMKTLLSSGAVLSAEPNNVGQVSGEEDAAVSSETVTAAKASSLKAQSTSKTQTIPASKFAKSTNITDSVVDLSGYQWAYNNTNATMTLPKNANGFQTNSPSWNTVGATNCGEDAVVAVFDTGIDYTHPDLADCMLDVQAAGYDPEQRGGRYGINTVSTKKYAKGDVMDDCMHGTHIAGIIAGEWNNKGVSGIASGVKLIAVKALDAEANLAESDSIAGFAYLSYLVKNGLNLTAVNCSWGGDDTSTAYALGLRELTETGTVVCFASGNSGTNNDVNLFTASSLSSIPGVIVVGNANKQGYASHSSCYGQTTVNVFAPGDNILSTVPSSKATYLSVADPSPAYFESFNGAATAKVYNVSESWEPFVETKTVGAASTEASFDSAGGCWKVPWSGDGEMNLEVRIPISEAQLAKMSSVGVAISVPGDTTTTLTLAESQSGEAMFQNVIDVAPSDSSDSWCYLSISVADLIKADNADGIAYKNGMLSMELSIADDGGLAAGSPVYIDAIGAGSNVVSYEICTGTSMATPVATGAAAVLASQIPSSVTGSARSSMLAAMVRSSVKQQSNLSKRCTSGGLLDLSQPIGSVPAITSISQAANNVVTLEGLGFGATKGTVTVSGAAATVSSWSDASVTFAMPASAKSGLADIVLTSSSGVKTVARRVLKAASSSLKLFGETISVPASKQGDPGLYQNALMTSAKNNLYMLIMNTDQQYKVMWRYSPASKKWTRCADLPAACVSAEFLTVGNRLVVYGTKANDTEKIFVYKPSTNKWRAVTAKNVPEGCGITAFHGRLVTVGGSKGVKDLKTIRAISLKTGKATTLGTMSKAMSYVDCAAYGDTIWAFSSAKEESKYIGTFKRIKWNSKTHKFTVSKLSKVKIKGDPGTNETLSLVGTSQGLIVAGVTQKDSRGLAVSRICRIKGTGKKAKSTVLQRVPSYDNALSLSACILAGKLYVRTASYYDSAVVSLRATTMRAKTLSYAKCSKTSYKYNGKARKPGVKVYNASGTRLKKGVNYTLSYRSNVKKGTAYVVVKGKGSYKGKIILPFYIS